MSSRKEIICVFAAIAALSARLASAESPSEPKETSGFHIGADLTIHQPVVSDLPILVPKLEAGLIIGRILDAYLALGLDIRRESFADSDRESSSTAGALMTELGARFIFGTPRPQSAFFYLGVAVAPVIGLSSYASEGDDNDDQYYEKRTREFLDRIDLGALMGVHYLIGESFGIGAETGFVTSLNNLKKTHREEPDKHLQVGFFIPFSLRAAYHF